MHRDVFFAPQHTGRRSALVEVYDNAPASPQSAPVSGYGNGRETWAPTGALASPRIWFAMTSLHDGDVLVTGGATATFDPVDTTELYNPKTGHFSTSGPLPVDRLQVTATTLDDGRVLVAGGDDGNFIPQSSAEIYDPTIGTWTTTPPMNTTGYSLSQTLLQNGNVLVTGLGDGTLAEVYHPRTATWTDTKPMVGSGYLATATSLPDGRVLVAGGGTSQTGIYDPKTNAWTSGGLLNTARDFAQAVLLPTGQVLLAGGGDPDTGAPLDSAELYDPATNSWSFTSNGMQVPRKLFTLTLMPDGNVLAAGGCNPTTGCDGPALDSSEYYNTSAGFWDPINDPMVHARELARATLLPSGDVLVVGGQSDNVGPRGAETFTPTFMTVIPTSGTAGTHIALSGNGFQAYETVVVQWNWKNWRAVQVGRLGRFTLRTSVPQDPPAQYAIFARGKHSYATAVCLFTETAE